MGVVGGGCCRPKSQGDLLMFNKRARAFFEDVQAKVENLSPKYSASGHSNSISQLPCTRTHHGLPIFSHSNCDHVEGEASGTGPSSPAKDPVVPPTYDLLPIAT